MKETLIVQLDSIYQILVEEHTIMRDIQPLLDLIDDLQNKIEEL